MSGFAIQLGLRMTLLIGPDPVALPASPAMLAGLRSVEIKLSDEGPSGIAITFEAERSGPFDMLESPLVADPRLDAGSRVVVVLTVGVLPQVIFDGLILERRVRPGSGPGEGVITLSGRDLAAKLDLEERRVSYPAQPEPAIVAVIAGRYAAYGMVPVVIPPPVIDVPPPTERIPVQRGSDWAQLRAMAARYGYQTCIEAGPAPMQNRLYWGPPVLPGPPQRALSANQGPQTDAYDIDIVDSIEAMTTVETAVINPFGGPPLPVIATVPTRPPLGAVPQLPLRALQGVARKRIMDASGLTAPQAFARATGMVDDGANGIRVTGKVDTIKYGAVLRARALVDLRGVGLTYDGTWKVSEVRHRIAPGSYEQSFTLSRGERLPLAPLVRAV